MKKLCAFILLIVSILNITVSATKQNLDAITAPTYLLADGNNDSFLIEENCTTNLGVSNFAKIMTAILSIEKFAPSDLLTFTNETHEFFGNGFGNIAITKPNMRFTVSEHLHNMILLYSDASAVALAKAHSGSEEAFVVAMNQKAKELSMNDTVFTSSDGHDANGKSKTSVYDLYKLMRYAMKLPLFREICGTVSFTLPTRSDKGQQTFTSRNHLLSKYTYSNFVYSPAVAGFISFSDEGASFISVCETPGKSIYALVMNTPDNGTEVYRDAINLAEHGFNSYQSVILAKKGAYLHQVPLKFSVAADMALVADKDISALLPYGYSKEDITFKATAPESVKAPVKAGDKIGTITYYHKGSILTTCNLIAEKDAKFFLFSFILRIFSKFNTWLILAVAITICIMLHFNIKRLHRKEELKKRKKEIMKTKD